MRLSGLQVRHFRNLAEQELDLPAEGVAIVGENAQGKTNLLEAIYYLETLRSFRAARDERLVSFGQEFFRVVGALVGDAAAGGAGLGEEVEVAAAFQIRGKRKKVTLNGQEPQRLGDGLGRVGAVVFSPADVALVSEGPGARRRFLDILLSLNVPGYLQVLQRFRHVLTQRNAALRDGRHLGTVEAWDEGLLESGALVMRERLRWVERRKGDFSSYFSRVSGAQNGCMEYQPGAKLGGARSLEEVAGAFREDLLESRERERRLGTTVVGPQRDDLRLTVMEEEDARDLREYGSGGQRRTAALALRLVEAATIREVRRQEPVVLMDDAFAELDPGRSERIMALMEEEETGQVVLTVPKESDIRLRRDSLPRWRIRNGLVES